MFIYMITRLFIYLTIALLYNLRSNNIKKVSRMKNIQLNNAIYRAFPPPQARERFAKAGNLSLPTVNQVMSGNVQLSPKHVLRIASLINLPPEIIRPDVFGEPKHE